MISSSRFWKLNKLAVSAALLYGVADFIFSWNSAAAAPYLAHRNEAVFRSVPFFAVGILAEAVNGWIAALVFELVSPALTGSWWRRGAIFGLMIWGFWVVSGTFSAYVWLSVPTSLVLTNVVFGLPKSLLIGCGISWFSSRLEGRSLIQK